MAATKTAAPAPVEIDTATLAKPIGRTAHIRIGGVVFEAKCPKDAVLARIQEEGTNSVTVIGDVMAAMIGKKGGEQVLAMLDDPDNYEVSLGTLSLLVTYLLEDEAGPQWGKALADNLKALGSGEKPRTIPVKRTTGPARSPKAVKRTTSRR